MFDCDVMIVQYLSNFLSSATAVSPNYVMPLFHLQSLLYKQIYELIQDLDFIYIHLIIATKQQRAINKNKTTCSRVTYSVVMWQGEKSAKFSKVGGENNWQIWQLVNID